MTAASDHVRESWDDRLDRVQRHYPSCRNESWVPALQDYDLMGRLFRDVLRVGNTPVRRGQRAPLELDEGLPLLQHLEGSDYSTLPFAQAFSALVQAKALSLTQVARKTGLGRSTVYRLIIGVRGPTGAEMEAVASGFGRPPTYFVEWRAGLAAAAVFDHFTAAPDASVVLARRLTAQNLVNGRA